MQVLMQKKKYKNSEQLFVTQNTIKTYTCIVVFNCAQPMRKMYVHKNDV